MNSPSILLTSAGRRTSLLKTFLEAAHQRGWRVIAGDMDPLAPALYMADLAIQLPVGISSPEYIRSLLETVSRENTRLVVPTIDPELPVMAHNAGAFAAKNCVALISLPGLVEIAADKWLTAQTYASAGVLTPRSWLPGVTESDLPEQLFIKPRAGSASQNAYPCRRSEFASVLSRVPNPIIQERLDGPEITVDALIDLNGRPIHFVPRKRIRTMSGESIQGVTICDDEIRSWLLSLLAVTAELGGRGPLTFQVFLTRRGPVLVEVNPRFAGGFPLTQAAGGHYPEWILRDLEHEELLPRFGEYRKGLYMTRYYVERFIDEPLWNRSVESSSI